MLRLSWTTGRTAPRPFRRSQRAAACLRRWFRCSGRRRTAAALCARPSRAATTCTRSRLRPAIGPQQQQVLYGRLQPIRLPEPPRPRPYHLVRQRHEEMLGSIASFVPYFDRSYPPTYVPRFYDSGETQFRIFFGQLSAGVTPARLQGLVYAITGASFTILRVADAECHTANGYCRNGTDQHVIVKSLNGRVVFDEDGAWLVDSGIGLEILKMYDAKAYNPHGPRRPLVAEPQPSQRTLRHSHGSRAAAASTEAAELLVAPLRYREAVTRRAQSHAEVLTPAIEKRLQGE
jgi:hypothetical protein